VSEQSFEERVISAANRTWDVIGGDCLVDDWGRPDESKVMTKDEVMEIVADAGHMEVHGGLSKEDMRRFYQELTWEERRVIMRKAFTYNRYGW